MKLFSVTDKFGNARKAIEIVWESLLMDIVVGYSLDDLKLLSNSYVVDKQRISDINSLFKKLPSLQNRFIDLLESGSINEVNNQVELMIKKGEHLLNRTNDYLRNLQNINVTDENRNLITRDAMNDLIRIRTAVISFLNELKK